MGTVLQEVTEKEVLMNTIDYRMEKRLTAWKAKIKMMKDLILRDVSQEGERFLRSNQDLNLPITEMSSRIEHLKDMVPTESTPQRKNIDNGLVDIRGKYVLRPQLSWTGLYGKEPWPREKKVWVEGLKKTETRGRGNGDNRQARGKRRSDNFCCT